MLGILFVFRIVLDEYFKIPYKKCSSLESQITQNKPSAPNLKQTLEYVPFIFCIPNIYYTYIESWVKVVEISQNNSCKKLKCNFN